ncbi:FecR family protein [Gaoshiqia sp. Z1-71]|uniref:FecR family protein n=1 Tax=Gaoshiqia hydrogeniformans TaxID=3290090 RepID=UPI003BF866AF
MKETEDISILLTDKDFQKILSNWKGYSEREKADIFGTYKLTAADVEILRQLWLGLDFCWFEHSRPMIESALNETLWKLAERKMDSGEKGLVSKLYGYFARVAAILLVPILLYTAYLYFSKPNPTNLQVTSRLITVDSQQGTITTLVLPDGSRVWLNAGSSLSYPDYFDGGIRVVSLSGEAYFEVVKDDKMPMVVSTGNLNVKVYGTRFNVSAFSSEQSVKVTLVEGSVSLSFPSGKLDGKDEFFVEAGQTVAFREDSEQLTVQEEDPFLHTAWKEGILIFRNETFETVLRRLSRKFNVDIKLMDKSLAYIPMDATFRDENINEILRLLSFSTPFKYYYGTREQLPDKTFAKSIIYIERE